ncbi:hypothetical protein EDF39_0567 [Frondihabitans sp. PhB161]|nr:hypothetical protein EDF37_0566 [Frondihabitans sp. PhB153]RPF08178.1 hypothetical protein EDF39_0567 [Frondihabitans sp. PhB161]
MARPDIEDSDSEGTPEEPKNDSPETSVGYLQFGADGDDGSVIGLVQEGDKNSHFSIGDDTDDEA